MNRLCGLAWVALCAAVGCSGDTKNSGTPGDHCADGSASCSDAAHEPPPVEPADKLDLLFMIDNSRSMADKQQVLAEAVPPLLERLVGVVGDIHIAVITSSLGGHGADSCSQKIPDQYNSTQEDNARTIGSVRAGQPGNDAGFLAWDPTIKPAELEADFKQHLLAAGEDGCGFEASLEAWYRFLIDPDPPSYVVRNGDTAELEGPDTMVLEQRQAFLRPDSMVAIIMLTDENDCSVAEGGLSWLVAQQTVPDDEPNGEYHLPPATSACATNPNDPCCRSCTHPESSPPAGCAPLTGPDRDPGCETGLNANTDPISLRCWQQKRRFGIDSCIRRAATPTD